MNNNICNKQNLILTSEDIPSYFKVTNSTTGEYNEFYGSHFDLNLPLGEYQVYYNKLGIHATHTYDLEEDTRSRRFDISHIKAPTLSSLISKKEHNFSLVYTESEKQKFSGEIFVEDFSSYKKNKGFSVNNVRKKCCLIGTIDRTVSSSIATHSLDISQSGMFCLRQTTESSLIFPICAGWNTQIYSQLNLKNKLSWQNSAILLFPSDLDLSIDYLLGQEAVMDADAANRPHIVSTIYENLSDHAKLNPITKLVTAHSLINSASNKSTNKRKASQLLSQIPEPLRFLPDYRMLNILINQTRDSIQTPPLYSPIWTTYYERNKGDSPIDSPNNIINYSHFTRAYGVWTRLNNQNRLYLDQIISSYVATNLESLGFWLRDKKKI